VRACVRRGVVDLAAVEGLGPKNVARLGPALALRATRVTSRVDAADGTTKLLVAGARGDAYESVLMPLSKRTSGCVSSQVGCAAACAFCASGLDGLRRSLEPYEIVEQALHLADVARERGSRLANLVFMGMGEPMHAYDAVVRAIRLLTDRRLLGFGAGHVTVSTVGVVPGILALAREGLGVHLAVSLHAADDALRARLLPVGGRWTTAEVLDAAETFRVATRRFVTVQATLLRGVNDGVEHAEALARAIAGRRFHVNLIPVNPVAGTPYEAPTDEGLAAFAAVLAARGVIAHVRTRRGSDVDAACGQLRRAARAAV
jgi:23S rRNA (adenine2503-C2)-methyltransferase